MDLRFLSGRVDIESLDSSPSPSPRIRFLALVKGESGCGRTDRNGLGDPGGESLIGAWSRLVGDAKRLGKEGNSAGAFGLVGRVPVAFFTGEKGFGRANGGNGSRSFSVGLECIMIGLDGAGALLVAGCCCRAELLESVLKRLYLSAKPSSSDSNRGSREDVTLT